MLFCQSSIDATMPGLGNTMAKKIRKIGSTSDSPPPAGAPAWAQAHNQAEIGTSIIVLT